MTNPAPRLALQDGQATIVGMGIAAGSVTLLLVLASVITSYASQARLQQAADIAAASLSAPRGDDPVARARSLAAANGARSMRLEQRADGGRAVVVSGSAPRVLGLLPVGRIEVRADVPRIATGTLVDNHGWGGASSDLYGGELEQVDAARVCPSVAHRYRQMQAAAAVAGINLHAVSGFRTDAEQADLYARLGPGIAAAPGTSLHRAATELDISTGTAGSPTHVWLTANAGRFGFTQRYSWEPWHWGNVRGC